MLNLQLHAELEHFDEDNFGIVFTWNQLPGELLMSREAHDQKVTTSTS